MNDRDVVTEIKREAGHLGLTISRRLHSGKFCTVYLEAPATLPRTEQVNRLRQAKTLLEANGVSNVVLTHFDNPPFFNRNSGKTEAGHPRHGDPLLELESVWWEENGN